ncbi:MAG: DUF3078 domain-containing protein [Flavobacterium sp.]
MKKIVFYITSVLFTSTYAQEATQTKESNWKKGGTFAFLANQSTFENWVPGGQSNFAASSNVNYDFNYKKDTWNWDNKLILAYGVTKIKDADIQKTDDRIEFNSLLGKKAEGYWFYSFFTNFKSQITTDLTGSGKNRTRFFSPAFLQIGPGMLWKKSDNLKVNIAPLTSRFVFVMDSQLSNAGAFGVDPGKNMRFELGASVSGYYKFNLMENVSVENILNLYTNYLDRPKNVDLDYQLNVVMKINKYLTTNFSYQTVYDDNAISRLQTRQVIGVGLNTKF